MVIMFIRSKINWVTERMAVPYNIQSYDNDNRHISIQFEF